jgi:hypothetical protein
LNAQLHLAAQRMFSSVPQGTGYDKTIKNMLINKNTKVVCQGFTGKQVNIGLPFFFAS